MEDSDLVGFLTTAIYDFEPFQPIKASLDTNAIMTKQEIMYDGMYNNCPKSARARISAFCFKTLKKWRKKYKEYY